MRARGPRASLSVLAAVLVACSTGADQQAGDLVEVDEGHPAAIVFAAGPTFQEFSEVATEQNREFVCAAGGGEDSWELCLVLGGNVLAVVPFDVPPGLTGDIDGAAAVGAVSLRLDRGAVGVWGVNESLTLTLRLQGKTVGSVTGP